jgi:hypothetical protein
VWWVIAGSLVLIALNLTMRDGSILDKAMAQNVRWAGSRGIFAFTGPLTPSTHGVFMVDVDTANLWCYELVSVDGVKRLRLVASRSWIHDRHLEDYNVDGLSPSDVEEMVNDQRARMNAAVHLPATGTNP